MNDKNGGKGVKSNAQKKAENAVKQFVTDSSFRCDPSGNYTGHPKGINEKPEQDVDDL